MTDTTKTDAEISTMARENFARYQASGLDAGAALDSVHEDVRAAVGARVGVFHDESLTWTTTITPVEFSGFSGRAARSRLGEHASLWLDPEDRTVSVYRAIGNGVPSSVWHSRSRLVALGADVELEGVEVVLRAHEGLIAELFALYAGTEWDGSNHVGGWSDQDRVNEIVEALNDAIGREGAVRSYWDAGDWMSPAKPDVMTALRSALRERADGDLDAAIESVASDEVDAASDEALIDHDDAVRELTRWAEDDSEIQAHLAGLAVEKLDITWHVAPADQGQTVEVAYAAGEDCTYRRETDRTCKPTDKGYRMYESADDVEVFEPWNGRVQASDGAEPNWSEVMP